MHLHGNVHYFTRKYDLNVIVDFQLSSLECLIYMSSCYSDAFQDRGNTFVKDEYEFEGSILVTANLTFLVFWSIKSQWSEVSCDNIANFMNTI